MDPITAHIGTLQFLTIVYSVLDSIDNGCGQGLYNVSIMRLI